jgi:hypothetical protein
MYLLQQGIKQRQTMLSVQTVPKKLQEQDEFVDRVSQCVSLEIAQ